MEMRRFEAGYFESVGTCHEQKGRLMVMMNRAGPMRQDRASYGQGRIPHHRGNA